MNRAWLDGLISGVHSIVDSGGGGGGGGNSSTVLVVVVAGGVGKS